jgi:hypothetical protein
VSRTDEAFAERLQIQRVSVEKDEQLLIQTRLLELDFRLVNTEF